MDDDPKNGSGNSTSWASGPGPSKTTTSTYQQLLQTSSLTTNSNNIGPSSVQWTATGGFDNNNNSSSCVDHEAQPLDISELAKTIGNEFRGEFIVLPHHLVNFDEDVSGNGCFAPGDREDEVSSASEDCVYAYRGDDHEPLPIAVDGDHQLAGDEGADNDDDETDFLEMDFDPEPNSEQENVYQPTQPPSPPQPIVEWRVERPEPVAGCSGSSGNLHRDTEELSQDPLTDKIHSKQSETNNAGESPLGSSEFIATAAGKLECTIEIPKVKESQEEPQNVSDNQDSIPHVPIASNTSTAATVAVANDHTNQPPAIVDADQVQEMFSCLECSAMELASSSCRSDNTSGSAHCRKHCKKLKNSEPEVYHQTSTLTTNDTNSRQIQICPNMLDEEAITESFVSENTSFFS